MVFNHNSDLTVLSDLSGGESDLIYQRESQSQFSFKLNCHRVHNVNGHSDTVLALLP